MEWFIIWVLFGIVTAVVAANKRRNVIGWLALGFLLGPFGLILALVVPKNQAEVEQEAIESGAMRKCPFCAELIRSEAVKCRFCGSEVPAVPADAPAPGTVQCPSCSKRIKPRGGETKCYLCGGSLVVSPPPAAGRLMTCPRCKQAIRLSSGDRECYFCHAAIESTGASST